MKDSSNMNQSELLFMINKITDDHLMYIGLTLNLSKWFLFIIKVTLKI